MPSYLSLISPALAACTASNPRWWLATNYDSLLKDPEAWPGKFRGPGVRCMTEDEIVGNGGVRTRTGKACGPAQKCADTMTAKYDDLAAKEPIFGELRNVMDWPSGGFEHQGKPGLAGPACRCRC